MLPYQLHILMLNVIYKPVPVLSFITVCKVGCQAKMMKLFIALCFTLVASEAPNYDDLIATLMTTDMTPNPGPEMGTVYIPGTPGGQWSPEEIDFTR